MVQLEKTSTSSDYKLKLSHVFGKTKDAYISGARFISNAGGARSGKTYSTLQLLLLIGLKRANTAITVTSENLPHLKRGAMKDFERILQATWPDPDMFIDRNKSNNTFTFKHNKSYIEFVSFADSGRARGPQRDILFCNEINNMNKETCDQLFVRTSKTIFVDYNPVAQFWVNEEIETRPDCVKVHSTYKDNDYLSDEQVADIERHKSNANWWRVYGLGLQGMLENLVYSNWDIVPDHEFPTDYKAEYYGIDFGYTNDPTALVWCGRIGDDLYIKQLIYRTGMQNPAIAQTMHDNGVPQWSAIVGDSAELKSIDEINRCGGYRIQPVVKGAGSILQGISILQRFRIHVAVSAVDVAKELRAYTWERDRNDNIINKPIDFMNHSLDALRYIALTYLFDRGVQRPHRVGSARI